MKTKPIHIKPTNLQPSKSYIDSSGNLVLHYTPYEIACRNIYKTFSVLPFVASFILCSLLLAEVLCFCGLIGVLVTMQSIREVYAYLLPLLTVGVMCTAGFGIAWAVAEEQERAKHQKVLAKETKHRNRQNDEPDYFMY
jgi:hypothetical protein